MEPKREIVHCHTCNNVQRDRRAYGDHLLLVHGEVARPGSDIPVRLEGRELEVVWALAHRSRMSGPVRAARRSEALGLPRVSDREAERRLKDNRACTARRHRAAACAREGATATLGAPEVQAAPEIQGGALGDRYVAQAGSSRAEPTAIIPLRTYSPCKRCVQCHCRRPKDYSAAQDSSPSPFRRPRAFRSRSSSSHVMAHPHTPHHGDHRSCGERLSRMRRSLTARARAPCPRTKPRPCSAWGRRP